MAKKWLNIGLAASVLASVTLAGCSSSNTEDKGSTTGDTTSTTSVQEINLAEADDIGTLDVSLTNNTVSSNAIGQLYEGLVHLDKDNKPAPGTAKSWEVSSDGLTYTFHLQDNAKWWDGTPVTAQDFVYSWTRTLDPKTKSEYAFILYWIKGAQDFNNGKGAKEDIALKAVDDKTLQVTLDAPRPYFIATMAFPTYYPLQQKAVEAAGDKYGGDVDKVMGNGPFKITSWNHDQEWVFEKADTYWDAANVKLTKATYQVVKDQNAKLNLYESGQLDRTGLTREQVELYKGNKEMSQYMSAGSFYLEYNTKVKPLNNVKVRQALSYALDSQKLVDVVWADGSVKAQSLTPKGTLDGMTGDYTAGLGDLIKQSENASKAKQLLEEGLKEEGLSAFPKLKLTNTDSSNSKKMDEFLKEQWRTNLGIDIEIEEVPFKLKVQKQYGHQFDIVSAGWNPDYDDAMTYLDMFVTGSPNNDGQWSNADYDALVKKATAEADPKKRLGYMQDAEKILLKELPLIPLYWPGATVLTKSYVKDWVIRKSSPVSDLKFVHIEGK
ncbi:MAG: peptide ABC transporter substrate-binding protein [Tumebacillaceae bacterium]